MICKAIILDNEWMQVQHLRYLLVRHFPAYQVIAVGEIVSEGINVVKELSPDLIFPDVETPHL